MSAVPQSVRKVSDDLAQMAVFPLGDQASAKRQHGKPQEMSRYRQTHAHLVKMVRWHPSPSRCQARKGDNAMRREKAMNIRGWRP